VLISGFFGSRSCFVISVSLMVGRMPKRFQKSMPRINFCFKDGTIKVGITANFPLNKKGRSTEPRTTCGVPSAVVTLTLCSVISSFKLSTSFSAPDAKYCDIAPRV
jgi:hypothetical protein